MIYYKHENDNTYKYEVTYDDEELMNLRNEIVDNCSLVTLANETTRLASVNKFTSYERRDVDKKLIKVDEFTDLELYELSYKKYIYPSIVLYLDDILLRDNVESLIKILNKDDISMNTLFVDEEGKLLKKFNEIPTNNIDEKRKALEEINEFNKYREYNMDKKAVLSNYYQKILNLFDFKFLGKESTIDVNNVINNLNNNTLIKKIGTNNN